MSLVQLETRRLGGPQLYVWPLAVHRGWIACPHKTQTTHAVVKVSRSITQHHLLLNPDFILAPPRHKKRDPPCYMPNAPSIILSVLHRTVLTSIYAVDKCE